MGRLALLYFALALVAALFGFGWLAADISFEIARLLSLAFLAFGLVTVVCGVLMPSPARKLG